MTSDPFLFWANDIVCDADHHLIGIKGHVLTVPATLILTASIEKPRKEPSSMVGIGSIQDNLMLHLMGDLDLKKIN